MSLNLKNADVERLVDEVVAVTGETKTEAIRRALLERRDRLALHVMREDGAIRLRRFLEEELWPTVPAAERGRRWSRAEEDELLGYGQDGT